MHIHFRPAPLMTLCAIPALLILLALGTWQMQRLVWKEGLIAEFESRATGPAIAPPRSDTAVVADMRFRRLALRGTFLHDGEVHLTGRTYEGTAGYHVITPMRLEDGRILMVNRGWVAEDFRRAVSRPQSLPQGVVEMEAILRLPQQRGAFVPANDAARDDWFTLDAGDIARHHGLDTSRLITAYTADALRPPPLPGTPLVMPIAADVTIDIPNDHFGYALTWYGIALALVGVYCTWHYQAGRLGFRR